MPGIDMYDDSYVEELQQEKDNAISELEDQREQSLLLYKKMIDQHATIVQLESTISRGKVALKNFLERFEKRFSQVEVQDLTATIEALKTNIAQLEEEKVAALASSSQFQLALAEKAHLIEEKTKVEEKHREEQARNKALEDQLKELSQKVTSN